MLPELSSASALHLRNGGRGHLKMDYNKKLEQLDRHLAEHPKDYQSVIARMKTYSDAVEHEQYQRKVARLKRVAEIRRMRNERKSQ